MKIPADLLAPRYGLTESIDPLSMSRIIPADESSAQDGKRRAGYTESGEPLGAAGPGAKPEPTSAWQAQELRIEEIEAKLAAANARGLVAFRRAVELQDELAAANARITQCPHMLIDGKDVTCGEYIAAERKAREEAEQDALRYRWLCENKTVPWGVIDGLRRRNDICGGDEMKLPDELRELERLAPPHVAIVYEAIVRDCAKVCDDVTRRSYTNYDVRECAGRLRDAILARYGLTESSAGEKPHD